MLFGELRPTAQDGVLGQNRRPDPASLFEDVFKEMPAHLIEQRKQAGF